MERWVLQLLRDFGFRRSKSARGHCSKRGELCARSVSCNLTATFLTQAFVSSLKQLATRHEILRTIYVHQAGMKFPFQAVLDAAEPSVESLDLTQLSEAMQSAKLDELFQGVQVPSVGPDQGPVLSATLVALGSNRYAVLISLPAMSADVGFAGDYCQGVGRVAAWTGN